MKKTMKICLILLLICTGCFLFIHRRVIRVWLTGSKMPKMPANHPKVCFHKKKIKDM